MHLLRNVEAEPNIVTDSVASYDWQLNQLPIIDILSWFSSKVMFFGLYWMSQISSQFPQDVLFCSDLPNIMNRVEMESIFRLTDIVCHSPQTVRVIECSARDGTGLAHIVQWIQQNTHL